MVVQRDLLPLPLKYSEPECRCPDGLQRASRSAKRRALGRFYDKERVNSTIETINEINGQRCPPPGLVDPSVLQSAGMEILEEAVLGMGEPNAITATGAFTQLCGLRPGYEESGPRVNYQREKISFPPAGVELADPGLFLKGQELNYWQQWQGALRRPLEESAELRKQLGMNKPYSDPALTRSPGVYAEFIATLLKSNIIRLRQKSEATVGIFCVAKSNNRQRIIFDTRIINTDFVEPAHTSLPSAAAWSQLQLTPGAQFHMAQLDVENAFYRIRVPPDADHFFILPPVSIKHLRAEGAAIPEQLASCATASPSLLVLPMGFSWSLYFCQALIEARVIASGVESCHFIRDRHTLPTLLPGHIFCAVYVDNVCMISTEAGLARKAAEAAFQCLESVGLKCHDVEQSEEETIFTGLSFDHKRRRISIKRNRAWTLYKALDFARKQPRMTGHQMEKLWGTLLGQRLFGEKRCVSQQFVTCSCVQPNILA